MATVYEGPVVTSVFTYAGRAVRMVRPSDPDRMLDDPGVLAWNRRDDYMPYWSYLWPTSLETAVAVLTHDWSKPGPGSPAYAAKTRRDPPMLVIPGQRVVF